MNNKMRVIGLLKKDGLVTIETLTPRSFFGIKLKSEKRTFVADEEYQKTIWDWTEPDMILPIHDAELRLKLTQTAKSILNI